MPAAICPSDEDLKAYVRGGLPPQSEDSLADHLEACPRCEAAVQTLEREGDPLLATLRLPVRPNPYEEEPECRQVVHRLLARAIPSDDQVAQSQVAESSPPLPLPLACPGCFKEYDLLEKLGEGAMGTVYKARHQQLKKLAAIKILLPGLAQDPQRIARFKREMKAVGQLDHPHIVRAMDAGEADSRHYLVMEYIEGLDLSKISDRVGRLAVADACEIIRQVAIGLRAADERGLIHRDIKPSNLMVTSDGQVKILDLGLAVFETDRTPDGATTAFGQIVGTLDYIAPEQINDAHSVDARADIYSLGCTLYKLLTGQPPFSGPRYQSTAEKMTAHLRDAVPPIRLLVPEVSEKLAAVLDRMLAKDRDLRIPTPGRLVDELAAFCVGANLAGLLELAGSRERGAGSGEEILRGEEKANLSPRPGHHVLMVAGEGGHHVPMVGVRANSPPASNKLQSPQGPSGAKPVVAAVPMNKDAKKVDFDPYHKWLGIPPEEQPANHYRLLGLQAFESDPEVIVGAVMRQSAHLKTYQLGQHAALTQKLLNEVSAAKVCLLDPQRKAAYDARLRKELEAREKAARIHALPAAKPLPAAAASPATPTATGSATPALVSPPEAIPRGHPEPILAEPVVKTGLDDLFSEIDHAAHPAGSSAIGRTASRPPVKGRSLAAAGARPGKARGKSQASFWQLCQSAIPPRFRTPGWLAAAGGAALAGVVLLGVLFSMRTSEGTLVVEISDPEATVQVLDDQGKLLIEQKAGGEKVEISVVPGKGKLRIVKNSVELLTKEFTLLSGGRETINARLIPPVELKPQISNLKSPIPPPTVAPLAERKAETKAEINPPAPATIEAGKWIDLFDGKTLDGWRVDGNATWTVSDGAIDGGGEGSGTLVSRQEFGDFEFQADVKINSAGNSGVFFRITPEATTSPVKWDATTVKWYEVQVIGSQMRGSGGYPHTGDLFGFAKVPENPIQDDEWFHLHLIAKGNHILVKIYGRDVLEYVDAKNTFTRGSIGLQKFGPPTRVSYKNIRIKALDGVPSSGARISTVRATDDTAGSSRSAKSSSSPTIGADGKWAPGIPDPAVAPFDETKAKEYQAAWAKYLNVPLVQANSIGMKLVLIPPGEFMMGSPNDLIVEELRLHGGSPYGVSLLAEGPQHPVRITKPYWLGATDVTQEEYQRVMGSNPSRFRDPKRPVEQVTWNDAVEFCRRLSVLPVEKAAKRRYGLPTEAQWEHACRAGTTTRWYAGDNEAGLGDVAWFAKNSGGQTHPVGQKRANAWGLYDMHGNVWQWCQDWLDGGYYAKSPADDPVGPPGGSRPVARGGGLGQPAWSCRSAYRGCGAPEGRSLGTGFRVVCEKVIQAGGDATRSAATDSGQPEAAAQRIADHFKTRGYRYGWVGGAANDGNHGEPRSFDVTKVEVDGDNVKMWYAWKNGVLKGVMKGRTLTGDWTQGKGHGKSELTFAEDFSAAEGWWSADGHAAKPRAFLSSAAAMSSPVPTHALVLKKKQRVLYFTRSQGYEHSVVKRNGNELAYSEKILTELGKENGFEVVCTKDGSVFDQDLNQWDAFAFYTCGDLTKPDVRNDPPVSPKGKQRLLQAIAAGKGFIGFHSATDTFHSQGAPDKNQSKTDPYIAMIGGEFMCHGPQQEATVTATSPSFPGADKIGGSFTALEEWYVLKNLAKDLHVVLLQDTEGMTDPCYQRPPYPETWARLYGHGQGRVFYTSLGHREDIWSNPKFQNLIVAGLAWVLRNVNADVTPNVDAVTPKARETPKVRPIDRRFFVGDWRLGQPNGADFLISLHADSTASSSFLGGTGKWEFIHGEARILWNTGKSAGGWHIIRREGSGFRKLYFKAGMPLDRPTNDICGAEKL